jgi:pyrroline-5-carboxylate reductase
MNISQETDQVLEDDTNPLGGTQLAFIGCGVMAEAIIAGLLRQRLVAPEQIAASHPRAARREELHARYGIHVFESNREAATFEPPSEAASANLPPSSIIVLAVKPQRLAQVLGELKGALRPNQLALSVVAGARLEMIAAELLHPAVVRTMPNTPAQIGQGMTAWTATTEVSEAQQVQVRSMLRALGREIYVESELMIDMA